MTEPLRALLAQCQEHAGRADDCGRLARAVLAAVVPAVPASPDVFGLPFAEAKKRILEMPESDVRGLAISLLIQANGSAVPASPESREIDEAHLKRMTDRGAVAWAVPASPSDSNSLDANLTERSGNEHTPGPWKHRPSIHGKKYRYVQIGADDCYTTLELEPADARLIAAAPDLLTALQDMLFHFGKPRRDEWMNDDAWQEAINAESRARAATAKATGEKP